MKLLTPHDTLLHALKLAEGGRFTVSPNPMVGCVIMKDDEVVGEGFHQYAGGHHAEIMALQQAGSAAQEATVYVTLEPCCHTGRTPPCTDSLIKAGVKRVYIASTDPNPLVAGKGILALEAANIEVHVGILGEQAQKLNEIFFHYMRHKRPFVIAKWAMSLDGKTITHSDDSRDISSQASQQFAHQTRQRVDAILIGSQTAIHDNPSLTARFHLQDRLQAKQPVRIILTSRGQLPFNLKIFDPVLAAKTIIATTDSVDPVWEKMAKEKNISVLILPKNKNGQVDLHALLNTLGKMEITSLLIEGGMTMHENFIEEDLVNQFHVYLAPVIIGKLNKKHRLDITHSSRIEADYYFNADIEVS